jgi:N-carbamoyl-L-amino-acid hydrolase
MPSPAPDLTKGRSLARELFATLRKETADEPGVTRISYGPGEQAAYDLMARTAAAWRAETAYDAAGNLFVTLPGRDRSRIIQIGSHLDSVPHGGNFDGAAGVILGIALQGALAGGGCQPRFDLAVACLRAEESCWFPHSYIGSKTALGILEPGVLDSVKRSDSGHTLSQHMREAGFDPDAVRSGARLVDPQRIVAHIEPHIEQGPALEAAGTPLAIVTGIRGSFRYRDARCVGEYAHSGATPHELRRDAVVATAQLVVALDELWTRTGAKGADLTITVGQLGTDPREHSFSKVAGETRFAIDVRSQNQETLDEVQATVAEIAAEIGSRDRVRFELGPRSGTQPAVMSRALNAMLAEALQKTQAPIRLMASGAGHDAATYALAGVPTTMLFIRNQNGSHNPQEAMQMADFDLALTALANLIGFPAERWLAVAQSDGVEERAG